MKWMGKKFWKIAAMMLATTSMTAASVRADSACCDTDLCDSGCATDCCDAPGCSLGLGSLFGGCNSGCDAGCCDSGCDSGCCDAGCLDSLTSCVGSCGVIKKSDRCFDDFISPMINFVFFEDPRTLTELRPIFVNHQVPDVIGSGVPAGGSIQLFALQFRIALSDRLSLIAVKDGVILDNTNGAVDGLLDDGYADVSAGLKYNFLRDTCRGTLGSAGFTYEIPMGSNRSLQSVGDGEFHFFGTLGQRLAGGNAHFLTSVGYRMPLDDELQSSSIHWSNHFDVRVSDRTYLFTELAWWHWTDDASNGAALGVGGQDLFNVSSNNIKGNDLVTQNVGMRFKPRANVETGIAYEFPLTGFKDVIDNRLMLDLIVRF